MDDVSLGKEISAEIQFSLEETADSLQENLDNLNETVKELRRRNLTRSTPDHNKQINTCFITSSYTNRPAFSSMLYGVVGLALSMKIKKKSIQETSTSSRSNIEVADYEDIYRQMKWDERLLMINLLESALEDSVEYDLILIDYPFTITRQDTLTHKESSAKVQWENLLEELDEFWKNNKEKIHPWKTDAPYIVGLSRTRSSLLFTALESGLKDEFVDDVDSDIQKYLRENQDSINSIGPNRIVSNLLNTGDRTIAYPYNSSGIDKRWLPNELNSIGVQGMFSRFSVDSEISHLEVPGDSKEWRSEELDELVGMLCSLSWIRDVEIPVPLWYAREECSFPDSILDAYYRKLAEKVRSD